MKKVKIILALAITMSFVITICGCGSTESSGDPTAVAPTGTYVGQDNEGVQEFLGIRYGEFEPFKAATDVTTTADDVIEAKEWGANSIQPYDEVEVASQDPCSQDCMFLNIWTKDSEVKDKPVIVWIHGGSNVWGGGTDPMYDGSIFVRNLPEGEDCVFVSINYRLSFLGGIDMSLLDGYTDEYSDAVNLRHLDRIQALKWVNENIDAWGGNADNVTVVGQSSGAMAVQCLMIDGKANRYFNRGIEASGVMCEVAASDDEFQEMSETVYDILGVNTIEELISLSDAEIADKMSEINEATFGMSGAIYADGEIISKTWFDDLKNGAAKDIDLMISSVSGEHDYEAVDYDNFPDAVTDENFMKEAAEAATKKEAPVYGHLNPFDYDGLIDQYLALNDDKVQGLMDLINDVCFTYPNILIAGEQSKWNDNTYVYYWEYAPDKDDVIKFSGESAEVSPWSRPLHSMDICFFFGTLENGYTELTGDPNRLPEGLMEETQSVYYNFAKTGDPNGELVSGWKSYDTEDKNIMVIKPDASWKCIGDYRSEYMNVLSKMRPYGEK